MHIPKNTAFNFNEFLSDGVIDKRKYLSQNELNSEIIVIISKFFTNWGSTNINIEINFGEIINFIENGEYEILTKRAFKNYFL